MGFEKLDQSNPVFELLRIANTVHADCHRLCKKVLGEYLQNSGNLGIFCQSEEQYEKLSAIALEITETSDNPNQKYFKLTRPIIIPTANGIPAANYEYLYIRKYDHSDYGKNLGDVDFVLPKVEYEVLKSRVMNGEVSNAAMYDRPGWDNIQLTSPETKVVSYISTLEMAKKVRVKFD